MTKAAAIAFVAALLALTGGMSGTPKKMLDPQKRVILADLPDTPDPGGPRGGAQVRRPARTAPCLLSHGGHSCRRRRHPPIIAACVDLTMRC